jgi:hypothetical protein
VDLGHVPLAGRERLGRDAPARRRTVAVVPALRVGTTRWTASRFRLAAGSVRAIVWSRATPAMDGQRMTSVAKRVFTDGAVATPTSPFSRTRTPPAARTARRALASDASVVYRTTYVFAIVARPGAAASGAEATSAAATAAATSASLRVMRILVSFRAGAAGAGESAPGRSYGASSAKSRILDAALPPTQRTSIELAFLSAGSGCSPLPGSCWAVIVPTSTGCCAAGARVN